MVHLLAMRPASFSFTLASGLRRRARVAAIVLAGAGVHGATVHAQLLERATVITDARIITGTGSVIETGSIVIKGGKIEAVGPDAKAPFLSKMVAAAGKTITPGFIDVWSALGTTESSGDGDATARAQDGFDNYARDDFREALRHGVTMIYVGADGGAGVNGTGAVIQLAPGSGRSAGSVRERDAALCVNLGSDGSPIARVKSFAAVRKSFQAAVDYRKSLEDYEEDLKEYLEKLEERNKKADAAAKGTDEPGEEKTPSSDKTPAPAPEDDENDEDEEKGDGDGEKSAIRALFAEVRRSALSGENGSNGDGNGDGKKNGKKDGEKKEDEDELKKPQKPGFDAKSEVVLKAIDHEFPVRIEAHRSADILNALALADEFNLEVVVEGATEAYLVADALAEAEVPIVLGQVGRTAVFEDSEFRRHTPRNAEILSRAGVNWLIGSGGHDPRASRFVALNAQMAMPHADTGSRARSGWIDRLTGDASRFLGLPGKVGSVARGMEADLVIWSGDPGDPTSIVERVFVGGKLAYVAPHLAGGGS